MTLSLLISIHNHAAAAPTAGMCRLLWAALTSCLQHHKCVSQDPRICCGMHHVYGTELPFKRQRDCVSASSHDQCVVFVGFDLQDLDWDVLAKQRRDTLVLSLAPPLPPS